MQLDEFNFELPVSLIAQYPAAQRSASRLLCLRSEIGSYEERVFSRLDEMLAPGDLVVVNDTRVIPARLFARKASGGRVEIMSERLLDTGTLLAMVRSSKPIKPGTILYVQDIRITVTEKRGGFFVLACKAGSEWPQILQQYGKIPLPPYIQREALAEDTRRYQTIFARHPGAVAAPTAGLHFNQQLVKRIKAKGVGWCAITLHVGAGTFQPVRVEDIEKHRMHDERVTIPDGFEGLLDAVRDQGRRVIAIGTTVVRALESAAKFGYLDGGIFSTDLFIKPGFDFAVVDALVTNFHLPRSTLLIMLSAFSGHERIMAAYRYAISQNYRFFSYGDAMFVERQ